MLKALELRCDANPGRLFAKVLGDPEAQPKKVPGNLIEVSCRDCRKAMEENGQGAPIAVLHRFDIIGELVETEAIWPAEERGKSSPQADTQASSGRPRDLGGVG